MNDSKTQVFRKGHKNHGGVLHKECRQSNLSDTQWYLVVQFSSKAVPVVLKYGTFHNQEGDEKHKSTLFNCED